MCRSLVLTLSTQLCSPLAGCTEPNTRKEHQVLVKQRRVVAAVLQLVNHVRSGTGLQQVCRKHRGVKVPRAALLFWCHNQFL